VRPARRARGLPGRSARHADVALLHARAGLAEHRLPGSGRGLGGARRVADPCAVGTGGSGAGAAGRNALGGCGAALVSGLSPGTLGPWCCCGPETALAASRAGTGMGNRGGWGRLETPISALSMGRCRLPPAADPGVSDCLSPLGVSIPRKERQGTGLCSQPGTGPGCP